MLMLCPITLSNVPNMKNVLKPNVPKILAHLFLTQVPKILAQMDSKQPIFMQYAIL